MQKWGPAERAPETCGAHPRYCSQRSEHRVSIHENANNPALLMSTLAESMGLRLSHRPVLMLLQGLEKTPHHTLPSSRASQCPMEA